jgi:hypothetical protein
MADFIHSEVNEMLANTCPGIYADVLVATIFTPEDLRRWIKYITKTVDLVGAVESVYSRYQTLWETDSTFSQFYRELQLYPCRSRSVFGMIRCPQANERGKHTYQLRRRYVRGNHKFGKGSILSESERHESWREACAERGRKKKMEETSALAEESQCRSGSGPGKLFKSGWKPAQGSIHGRV